MNKVQDIDESVVRHLVFILAFASPYDAGLFVYVMDILAAVVVLLPVSCTTYVISSHINLLLLNNSCLLRFLEEAGNLHAKSTSLGVSWISGRTFRLISDLLDSGDWTVRVSALTLINAIVVKFQDEPVNERAALRKSIEDTGMLKRINFLERELDCPDLFYTQWRVYTDDREEDMAEVRDSFQSMLDSRFGGADADQTSPLVFSQLIGLNSSLLSDPKLRFYFLSTLDYFSGFMLSMAGNPDPEAEERGKECIRVFEGLSQCLKVDIMRLLF